VNLYCNNYRTCNSYILDLGTEAKTEARARAAGWHIFHGTDHGGRQHDAVLCAHCASSKRRELTPAPPLQRGQQTLFSLEVSIDQEAS